MRIELLSVEVGCELSGSLASSASNESESEWAGSVESTIVRSPDRAHRAAVAAATVVLPTSLAREEQDPHVDSARAFRSRRAVCMMRLALAA